MQPTNEKLIVALDVPTAREAIKLVDGLGDSVTFYKVGMQLYFAEGNSFVRALKGRGKKVFLDLKLNDIPETVAKAVASVAGLGVEYLTLFTNAEQVARAADELKRLESPLKILNVTVLTSETTSVGAVDDRTEMTLKHGGHGVICSGQETRDLREKHGNGFIIINPGIRPQGAVANDQVRVVTPKTAIADGATHIVVGRPITQATNPSAVAEQILDEIARA